MDQRRNGMGGHRWDQGCYAPLALLQVNRWRSNLGIRLNPSGSDSGTDREAIWVDHSATSAHKDNMYAEVAL